MTITTEQQGILENIAKGLPIWGNRNYSPQLKLKKINELIELNLLDKKGDLTKLAKMII